MKPELIEAAWQYGRVVTEADGVYWRQDACGAWMRRDDFGREDSEFGWKIEKISAGGPDTAETLRPFNVRNRYDVAVGRPQCRVTADRSHVPAETYVGPPRNRPA